MIKKQIILVGGGGHAKACLDVIESDSFWHLKGYLDVKQTLSDTYGLAYLGSDAEASKFVQEAQFLITVGQLGFSPIREKLYNELKKLNAEFAIVKAINSIISKKSIIGCGTIVMHGAILQADTSVGENCIINDRVLIEHGSIIGNHCHISTGVIINGEVRIGNGVFIGSGSVLRNGITIGDNCVIGMGSVVTKSISHGLTVFGNPAM
jgi:sugar O-acyltransferase (sialic acid O-acetyltransferase NeuD family)